MRCSSVIPKANHSFNPPFHNRFISFQEGCCINHVTSTKYARRRLRSAICATMDEGLSRRAVILSTVVMTSSLDWQLSTASADDCKLISSPSGIQFCDGVIGSGETVQEGTLIRAHYTGRLASDMKVFDSSYPRGRPLVFKIGAGEVIKGWDLGILGTDGIPPMKAGGKRRLVIPPELGYGEKGAGRGIIPPNATLIFDVEFLGAPQRK
eukprot:g7617.t1